MDLPEHLYDDFAQEANIGLARAAQKYDPKHGTTFSTYAYYWIRQRLFRALKKANMAPATCICLDIEALDVPDRSHAAVDGDMVETLRQGLAQLPDLQRLIITAQYLAGPETTSLGEISRAYHLTEQEMADLAERALYALQETPGLEDFLARKGE